MLLAELIEAIDSQYPCRTSQLNQLSVLVNDDSFPSPPLFVVHGLEAVGKTLIVRTFLEKSSTSYSWLPCHECITTRHLTERIAATVACALGVPETQPRCENVGILTVYLQNLMKGYQRKHFLVLDRIDLQREPAPTLLASLRRMGEFIPMLTVIFIMSTPQPRSLSSAEVPHVHFMPYNREESIEILCKTPLPIKRLTMAEGEDSGDEDLTEEDIKEDRYVWQKFCAAIWDSLAKGAARNVVQFRAIVEKNWLPFVQPIVEREFGTRNFSSLYLFHKDMFRRENTVIDTVIPSSLEQKFSIGKSHDLPYYSKFLLCAAYLASYNPARLDVTLYVKANDSKKKRRGGGNKRQAGTRKIQRRLLGPQSFPIERLLAIFPAITPHGIPSSVDIQTQIATLASLTLLAKVSAFDPLDGATKWKVNVGWEYIRSIARSIKFDIEDYITE